MIESTCPLCGAELSLRPEQLILGRRFPYGDGSLAYCCDQCRNPVAVFLDFDGVMSAVFAGVEPIDEWIATQGEPS